MKKFCFLNNKYFICFSIALTIVIAFYALQNNKGLSLADEGFLWYGAQRIISGEVPILDFMAYDPGRYYWCAGFMKILGDNGVIGFRLAVKAFQLVGLFIAVLLVYSSYRKLSFSSFLFIALSAITISLWLFPTVEDSFDSSLSIISVGVLSIIVNAKSIKSFFISGFFLGIIIFFGRNHGVYLFLGSVCVFILHALDKNANSQLCRKLYFWLAGIAIGLFPIILMIFCVPGFGLAFWESVRSLIDNITKYGGTNLSLTIPWPWLVSFSENQMINASRLFVFGVFIVALPVFGFLGIIYIIMQKTLNRALPASMVAATILILPYSHYVYSRADWYHLCRGISPFLLATIIFIASKKKRIGWVLIVVLFSSSLWVMHNKHPYWQCKYGSGCVDLEISGTTLLVNSQTKSIVDYSRLFVEKYANNNKGFLAVPSLVSLYPIMERKAPVWETYPLFHRSSSFQLEEIERIKSAKTSLVILDNSPIDGNDELRYKNTHKLIYSYILENFEMHPISRKSNYDIYVRKTEL